MRLIVSISVLFWIIIQSFTVSFWIELFQLGKLTKIKIYPAEDDSKSERKDKSVKETKHLQPKPMDLGNHKQEDPEPVVPRQDLETLEGTPPNTSNNNNSNNNKNNRNSKNNTNFKKYKKAPGKN